MKYVVVVVLDLPGVEGSHADDHVDVVTVDGGGVVLARRLDGAVGNGTGTSRTEREEQRILYQANGRMSRAILRRSTGDS